MSNDRADALETLLASPGWGLFREHCDREWGANGAKYQAELDKALNLTDDIAAASQARQIRAARRMVETLVSWPQEELARVRRNEQEPEVVMSRGGYHR